VDEMGELRDRLTRLEVAAEGGREAVAEIKRLRILARNAMLTACLGVGVGIAVVVRVWITRPWVMQDHARINDLRVRRLDLVDSAMRPCGQMMVDKNGPVFMMWHNRDDARWNDEVQWTDALIIKPQCIQLLWEDTLVWSTTGDR